MGNEKLHPSIEEFKQFVKKHPNLKKEVRKGTKTWQELYEEWYLLGEDDEVWQKFKVVEEAVSDDSNENSKHDFMTKIVTSIKNVNITDIQKQISNVGSAISTIQQVIQQFQGTNQPSNNGQQNQRQNHPFAFRKD